MPQTLTDRVARTLPNDLRATPAKVRTVVRSDSQSARTGANVEALRMRDVVRDTMRDIDLSQKAMAICAGCSEGDLSDALNGREGRRFEAEWLWRQDDVFLRRFLDRMAQARGLSSETELQDDIELITMLFGRLVQRLVQVRRSA